MTTEDLGNILSKYPAGRKDGLLPILQEMQNQQGYLTDELITEAARYLNMPANKVYGVATFYDQFRFHPQGLFHVKICSGTACHLHGSFNYRDELEKHLKVKAGNTSKDRKFSLEVTTCMGACESGPVVLVNETFYTNVTAAGLDKIIRSLKEKTE
ncbi:MAG: NADH-quinone oxidoreductase subunit NuoE [bacterium]